MPTLFCVELGIPQRKNLHRVTNSIIVMADTPEDATSYVGRRCPELLHRAAVQRVFEEVEHVVVNWPTGEVSILEKD